MPQRSVARPFGERDFGDEHRLDPVRAPRLRPLRRIAEAGLSLDRDRASRGSDAQRCRPVKPGADLARVAQLPVRLVARPSSSAPKPPREPSGSVKPPTTISWRRLHLIFCQRRAASGLVGRGRRAWTPCLRARAPATFCEERGPGCREVVAVARSLRSAPASSVSSTRLRSTAARRAGRRRRGRAGRTRSRMSVGTARCRTARSAAPGSCCGPCRRARRLRRRATPTPPAGAPARGRATGKSRSSPSRCARQIALRRRSMRQSIR